MANKTVTVKSSGGDYTSLNSALAGESTNLVSNTRILTINCTGFEDTTAATTGAGYTTSSSYYIKIVGDNYTGKSSSSCYRLNIVTTGYITILNITAGSTQVYNVGFTGHYVEDYRTITAIDMSSGPQSNYVVDSCIFYDLFNTSYTLTSAIGILWSRDATIRNNVFYNLSHSSCANGSKALYEIGGFGSPIVENNTIYNVAVSSSVGIYITCTNATVRNNLVLNSGTDYYPVTTWNIFSTCGSSDTSGTSGLRSLVASNQFTNLGAGTEDLSLKGGADSIGVGTDLSSSFTTDITGATRTVPWDIGAFMYTSSSVDATVTATGLTATTLGLGVSGTMRVNRTIVLS
jgi:hypothetical protein